MSHSMDRRAALRRIASGAVGAATSGTWVASLSAFARQQAHAHAAAQAAAAAPDWKPKVLTPEQNELVALLAELIIPETDTPGARAVGVNRFIDAVLLEAPAPERKRFLEGLAWIDARSRALFKRGLAQASSDDQVALLTRLSAPGNPDGEAAIGREFFQAIKSMTIEGYYTTEVGLRQELGDNGQLFLPKFEGCTHPEHGA